MSCRSGSPTRSSPSPASRSLSSPSGSGSKPLQGVGLNNARRSVLPRLPTRLACKRTALPYAVLTSRSTLVGACTRPLIGSPPKKASAWRPWHATSLPQPFEPTPAPVDTSRATRCSAHSRPRSPLGAVADALLRRRGGGFGRPELRRRLAHHGRHDLHGATEGFDRNRFTVSVHAGKDLLGQHERAPAITVCSAGSDKNRMSVVPGVSKREATARSEAARSALEGAAGQGRAIRAAAHRRSTCPGVRVADGGFQQRDAQCYWRCTPVDEGPGPGITFRDMSGGAVRAAWRWPTRALRQTTGRPI
jgi:hypothetical protein